MKSSLRDRAEGRFRQVKGRTKDIAGDLSDHLELEAEGTDEEITGQVRGKVGQGKKALGLS